MSVPSPPLSFGFDSLYGHGFARVAACAVPSRVADPHGASAGVLAAARACHEDGVAVAVFPELCLSGYAIDDLLLQDAAARRGRAARWRELVEASADLMPVLVVGAPLRSGGRLLQHARVVIHRGELLGVVPKIHLPNYREFYERRQFASGDGVGGRSIARRPATTAPFGTDLLFAAEDVPGFVARRRDLRGHVGAGPAVERDCALAGATVLANLSGSPITIGRADTRRLLCPVAVRALPRRLCLCRRRVGRVDHRPRLGRPDRDLRERRAAGRGRALPPRATRSPSPTSISTCCARSACGMGTFDDNRRRSTPRDRSGAMPFRLDAARRAISACAARSSGSRSCPADPTRLDQDCYEAYNIQVAGLVQRLRATGTQARRASASPAGSTRPTR